MASQKQRSTSGEQPRAAVAHPHPPATEAMERVSLIASSSAALPGPMAMDDPSKMRIRGSNPSSMHGDAPAPSNRYDELSTYWLFAVTETSGFANAKASVTVGAVIVILIHLLARSRKSSRFWHNSVYINRTETIRSTILCQVSSLRLQIGSS